MPQDLLQIALEHHRAGRMQQAEAGYRDVLAFDPANAEAAHWLGVLMCQAGRPVDAVPLLERAAAARPEDPALVSNLGQAYLSCGRAAAAIEAFDRALHLKPEQSETMLGAALARIARNGPGDAAAAAALLERARAAGVDSPELHRHRGLALLLSGRPGEAVEALALALARRPDDAEAYHHLAAASRATGDLASARMCLEMAIQIQPTHAPATYALAVLEAEAGDLPEAERLMRRALELKPDSAAAREGLAQVLRQSGRRREARQVGSPVAAGSLSSSTRTAERTSVSAAIAALERRLTRTPEMANQYFLIASRFNVAPPAILPRTSVERLFDRYADYFDEHLVGKLRYQVPERLAAAVAAMQPAQLMDVLDLGCGTGLCGPPLRPMAASLVGVDLSAAMLEQAAARGVYDRLIREDLVIAMRAAPIAYDLIVAADTLIYLGDLAPAFEAAVGALREGGLFAFSVEATEAIDRYALDRASRRYRHASAYVRRLAAMFGFEERSFEQITARLEAHRPVPAHLLVLQKGPA